jgi:hypothetical protein
MSRVAKSMRVRLIKKFAEIIDGVDLRGRSVGDLLNLRPSEAKLLIAEQWAVGGESNSYLMHPEASDSDDHRSDESSGATVPRRRG